MEIPLKPWGDGGDWILLCPQRGIGAPGMAMPEMWHVEMEEALRERTGRHVEVRMPPSRMYGQPPLDEHLSRAHCVVVWTSNVATHALLAGVPAFYCGEAHIMSGAMKHGIEDIETPARGDRQAAFRSLAWAQWTDEEIRSGEAFKALLERYYDDHRKD